MVVLPKDRWQPEYQRPLLALDTSIECYDWNKHQWLKNIVLPFVYGITISANERMDSDTVDGILGLGLGRYATLSSYTIAVADRRRM